MNNFNYLIIITAIILFSLIISSIISYIFDIKKHSIS